MQIAMIIVSSRFYVISKLHTLFLELHTKKEALRMDKIQMMGKLVIKQVVTDGYKQKAGQQFQTEIDKVDSDIAVYDENMQKAITKLTLKGDPNVEMYRRQFMAEKEKLAAYKEGLKDQVVAKDEKLNKLGYAAYLEQM